MSDIKKTVFAIDCETVGVAKKDYSSLYRKKEKKYSTLARVSIVDKSGDCIYNEYVKPSQEVIDYGYEFDIQLYNKLNCL